jgi:diguanylate cyclase (GGDEF)-like protein
VANKPEQLALLIDFGAGGARIIAPIPGPCQAEPTMNPTRSIKGLLLSAGVALSVAFSIAAYGVVSSLHERSVREHAIDDAGAFAQLTFGAMFELMSTGWSRSQLEAFVQAIRKSASDGQREIDIYRAPKVSALFGEIAQKAPDAAISQALSSAASVRLDAGDHVRVVFPLVAQAVCLRCHANAAVGEVLGAIDVRQDVSARIAAQRSSFMAAFAPIVPIALLATLGMVAFIRRRLDRSIESLADNIRAVNKLADLRLLEARPEAAGFAEFDAIGHEVARLTQRIRSIAVDRDMLEFEIRLLEKFILTSDVIKDWREYVIRLVVEIDSVTPAYALFSLFKTGEEAYDLEVFWRHRPSEVSRREFEQRLREVLARADGFVAGYAIRVEHHVASTSAAPTEVTAEQIDMQLKSLVFDSPKIGGIVGIGMHASSDTDEMRLLVVESILATLLNVVGSVKAIDKYTKDLEYYATRDPLTNLYNQRVFWELADNEVARSARHAHCFSLLVIDIDNFKTVNDSYGHAVGDRFVQQVVDGIQAAIAGDTMLSRYGGDEFTVILPETPVAAAHAAAQRIVDAVAALSVPVPGGARINASVSVGIATYPDHAVTARDLFLFADNMMYRAKAEGKNRVLLPQPQDVVEAFRSMGEKSILILNAVEQRSVVPFYQPIVDVRSGRVEALEVLSRIRLDDGSHVAADDYVTIAEKMGVMHKLDFIQLDKALAAAQASGYEGLLFINMSPRALVLNDFVPQSRRIAEQYKFDPQRLVFEITERETIKNMALLERFIATLRGEGFRLAIDDFGSGFSSFHYVKRFAIDFLKIEGDFILGMAHNDKDRALVRSIVALSQDLGIRTVAEHVEDAGTLGLVRGQRIDLAQGYHIRRPNASIDLAAQPNPVVAQAQLAV